MVDLVTGDEIEQVKLRLGKGVLGTFLGFGKQGGLLDFIDSNPFNQLRILRN